MITFTKIIGRDIFSYPKVEFTFHNGIFNISGCNGSGKSSLFHILSLLLFNRCPKETLIDSASNYVTGEPWEVEGWFTDHLTEYYIRNSRKSGAITIKKDGKVISTKKIPDNLKLIESILGCSYEQFVFQCFQDQSSAVDLLEDTKDSARKSFIDSLLNFDELEVILKQTEEKRKQLSGKTGKINSLRDTIRTLESSIVPLQEKQKELPVVEIEEQISFYSVKIEELSGKTGQLKAEYDQLKLKVQQAEKEEETRKLIQDKTERLNNTKLPVFSQQECWESILSLSSEKAEAHSERCALWNELVDLRKAEELGKCNSCGAGVESGFYSQRIAELEERCKDLGSFVDSSEARIEGFRECHDTWKLYNSLSNDVDKLKADLKSDFDQDLGKLKEESESKFKEYQANSFDLKRFKDDLEVAQANFTNYNNHNQRQRAVTEVNRKITESNQKINLQLDKAKSELAKGEYEVELCGDWKRVIELYKVVEMKGFLSNLNQVLRKYLELLCGNTLSCSFYLDAEGKIQVRLNDAFKEVPYKNLSSGQKARIKLATLFGTVEIVSCLGKSSFNVLFLDEVFGSLDSAGKEGLAAVLSYLKNSGKSIYVVAHSEVFADVLFDGQIKINYENGLSSIEV